MKDDIIEDINFIKNELESLNLKVDSVLDMLNNFTLMLIEETEDDDIYDSDDSWVPDQAEDWNSYDDEDEDDI